MPITRSLARTRIRDGHTLATDPIIPNRNEETGAIIGRIENALERIMDDLKDERELTIDFVSDSKREARKFAQVLLILQLSHDALVTNEILTKRHIFYQHQELFGHQRRVDELVDCVALTLEARREDLNIVAASKGVIAGPLTIRLHDDTVLDASIPDMGISIPMIKSIDDIDTSQIQWILVVEKDAIFRSLCSSEFWRTAAVGQGLIVTAKGYPDDLTCAFLRFLNEVDRQLPVLVLVDCDPDGLNIFRCYRYGSARHGSINNTAARWLGIKTGQTLKMGATACEMTSATSIASAGNSQSSQTSSGSRASLSSISSREPITQLSKRDRKLAASTLDKVEHHEEDDEQGVELKRELQIMLVLGVKTEIQWLDESGSLVGWLDNQLQETLL